jgi:hypothetical protein
LDSIGAVYARMGKKKAFFTKGLQLSVGGGRT